VRAAIAEANIPNLDVPIAATVSHNVFSNLIKQAEGAVVEVIADTVASSFEAELAALQAKHGFTGNVKFTKPKAEKALKVSRIVQNGITRPADGTLCGLIWLAADHHTTPTSPAQIAQLKADVALKDVNDHTIKTQYARWRQFNGVTGRLQNVSKIATPTVLSFGTMQPF
jgi:hypothetical protein